MTNFKSLTINPRILIGIKITLFIPINPSYPQFLFQDPDFEEGGSAFNIGNSSFYITHIRVVCFWLNKGIISRKYADLKDFKRFLLSSLLGLIFKNLIFESDWLAETFASSKFSWFFMIKIFQIFSEKIIWAKKIWAQLGSNQKFEWSGEETASQNWALASNPWKREWRHQQTPHPTLTLSPRHTLTVLRIRRIFWCNKNFVFRK